MPPPPPPKSSLTSSFSVSDASNEVVCPLRNQDGSSCRKRCFGEKRYRSMQEHIRRAHPEHYIAKLPATEESFNTMINTPPSERPAPPPPSKPASSNVHSSPGGHPHGYESASNYYTSHSGHSLSSPIQSRHSHEARRSSLLPAASAAAALAQLHNSRPENEWDHEQTPFGSAGGDHHNPPSHSHQRQHQHHHQHHHQHQHQHQHQEEDSYLSNFFANDGAHELFHDNHNMSPPVSREYLAPGLQRTPSASARASSLQPFARGKPNRPRKSSVTENARKPKHERDRSKDYKRLSYDRKAYSAEPQAMAALGSKRWEDLLDAAASATEEDSRDLTPIPQSPRSSIPPFAGSSQQQPPSYTASPLQNSVLPRTPDPEPAAPPPPAPFSPNMQPFPSVEAPPPFEPQATPQQQPYHQHHHHQPSNESAASSNPYATSYQRHHQHHSSGSNFHMQAQGLSSSPDDHHNHQQHQHTNSNSTAGHAIEGSNSLSALARAGLGGASHALHAPSALYGSSHPAAAPHHHDSHRPPSHHSAASVPAAAMPGPAGATATSTSSAGNYSLAPPASPPAVQHYCAACRRLAPLTSSYACTECICGICRECVEALISMGPNREAPCPRCQTVGGRFKPFMIDLR